MFLAGRETFASDMQQRAVDSSAHTDLLGLLAALGRSPSSEILRLNEHLSLHCFTLHKLAGLGLRVYAIREKVIVDSDDLC